jgi:phosphoribosylglycinamide formyltransferase-1
MRLGLLASHRGTNLQAIVDACKSGKLSATPAVVISNNSRSGAAERAQREGIPFCHLSGKTHPDPAALDTAILEALEDHRVELVILAGYMKKLGPRTLGRYGGRILNTHPALLPKFGGEGMYGRHVHEAVLAAGESETGVSIHIVDEEYDTGPVVSQCRVPVMEGDDPDTLAERVQTREREFYVETLRGIVEGRVPLPE